MSKWPRKLRGRRKTAQQLSACVHKISEQDIMKSLAARTSWKPSSLCLVWEAVGGGAVWANSSDNIHIVSLASNISRAIGFNGGWNCTGVDTLDPYWCLLTSVLRLKIPLDLCRILVERACPRSGVLRHHRSYWSAVSCRVWPWCTLSSEQTVRILLSDSVLFVSYWR